MIEDIKQKIQIHDVQEMEIFGKIRTCYLITCIQCSLLHWKAQCEIIKGLKRNALFFCSRACHHNFHSTEQKVSCTNCGKDFYKLPSQIAKSKSGNNFCSKSCAAVFNNKHKEYGTRRSKLEEHIEQEIKNTFPNLTFICNGKELIGSELDFYFPTLNIAIQINGPLHLYPIYGQEKLNHIQEMDQEKINLCKEKNIKLIEIDCSNDKYLNKKLKNQRWQQIKTILEEGVSLDLNALAGTAYFPGTVASHAIHLP